MQVVDIYQYLFHCVLFDSDIEGQYWNMYSHMVASCIWKILASSIHSHSFEVDLVVPVISLYYFQHRKLWTTSKEVTVSISGHYYVSFISFLPITSIWCAGAYDRQYKFDNRMKWIGVLTSLERHISVSGNSNAPLLSY